MQDLRLETIGPFGDCAVLRVAGEVDVYTAPALREGLIDLLHAGARHVIVDTSEITFLDSTGLGVLVGGLKRLRAHDGSLALACGQERVTRLLDLTGLNRLFPPYPTVADAIESDPHWRAAIGELSEGAAEWCRVHELT